MFLLARVPLALRWTVLLPLLVACTGAGEKEGSEPQTEDRKVACEFTAYGPSLSWDEGDCIWVDGERFEFSGHIGAVSTFKGLADPSREHNLAFSPYDEIYSLDGPSAVLPSVQTARKGTSAWPLCYAVSDKGALPFRHLSASLKFTLAKEQTGVQTVTLRGNGSEDLSGRIVLRFAEDGVNLLNTNIEAAGKSITLKGPFEAGGTYILNLLPGNFRSGFTLTLISADGTSKPFSFEEPLSLAAGQYHTIKDPLGGTVVPEPETGGIGSLADWQAFKAALKAGEDVSAWCKRGEVFLASDISGLEASDMIDTLSIPFNGNGKTISFDINSTTANCALFNTLSADVHDLKLAGTIDYGGTAKVGALAALVTAPCTISTVSSSANIRSYSTSDNTSLLAGGLVASSNIAEGKLTFKNCSVTGEIRAIQHVFAVGGIIAHGGNGTAPEIVLDGCNFGGRIEYGQSSGALNSSGGERGACRIGGLIGDASRIVTVKDCSTTADAAINVRLNGWSMGGGGIGGLVGRSTKTTGSYTMKVSFSGENVNRAAISVYDILPEQKSRCSQILGSVIQAYEGGGTEAGSLSFQTSAPPGPMSGAFSLCQVSCRKMSNKKDLTGTTQRVGTNYMSYFMVTSGGKVMVLDGGFAEDLPNLKSLIRQYGGHVDKWFISHPHGDHFTALMTLLGNLDGISIGEIVYSRCKGVSNDFYNTLDALNGRILVTDIQQTGLRLDVDDVGIKVLSIADPHLHSNLNNSSMALRVWDANKTVVFLGDAGVPLGHKLISDYKVDLDCDYLQLGHHGNFGCDEYFYRTVHFSYALVPTAMWIWQPELFYKSMPSNLDGGVTRKWIESILPADHIINSYDNYDWWLPAGVNP